MGNLRQNGARPSAFSLDRLGDDVIEPRHQIHHSIAGFAVLEPSENLALGFLFNQIHGSLPALIMIRFGVKRAAGDRFDQLGRQLQFSGPPLPSPRGLTSDSRIAWV